MPTTQNTSTTPIALCYLGQMNDEKNVCHLYSDHLSIIYKGKRHYFNRNSLREVRINHKKLLFPLISGGIIGTFFLISAFNFSINIWISLTLSCLGFISFYLGWNGTSTFSVTDSVKEYDFFLYQISKPLTAFSQFINEYIISRNPEESIYFYLPFSVEEWGKSTHQSEIKISKKTYLYTRQQIDMHNIRSYLKIDTSKTNNPIHIDTEQSNLAMAPFLNDSINKTAVEWINL
ncbi:MAG: hypothetical protein OEX22_12835 [Cyclobacteriaceae bacterium]|nr:hypothetical protein [Cyclobacteriaceae bacterium]